MRREPRGQFVRIVDSAGMEPHSGDQPCSVIVRFKRAIQYSTAPPGLLDRPLEERVKKLVSPIFRESGARNYDSLSPQGEVIRHGRSQDHSAGSVADALGLH